ncbi:metallophosphoesterase family protein [Bradyrhizobium sp. RDM4]|uniref:metallophosphoesterase family protein n=1 Tax=Bradyrhizobium sp. RDM4 TaxID=3378765 RepID=UPI0038FC74BF
MSLRIGVISDTHGLLRPEVEHYLAGVSHIIHAGDIGTPDILERLRRIAPVTAIRGNVDVGNWARHYPETETLRLGGRGFYLLHDLKTLEIDPAAHDIDAVISGHSHRVQIKTINGILFLNPGSAGPRRFHLPITLATLDLDETGALQPMIHHLDR